MRISILIIIQAVSLLVYGSTPQHGKYFQQYVNYEIDVDLDIDLNRLRVNETLLYTNHSPDTLQKIYFHLYINKYQRKSLAFPANSMDRGGIRIFQVIENDSVNKSYKINHTLMELSLHNALSPGSSVRFKFKFATILPPMSDRYGYQGTHYDVGNWYITPVVYDRAGWHLHQHLDNEFYQEWGDYTVNINVPQGFMVGATGNLLNASTVLHDDNLKKRGWLRADNKDTTLITWEYEAHMVHDFAWVTDPDYMLMQSDWNGITLNVLAFKYNEESWSQVKDWGLETIKYFCETIGMYPYKQLTVADTYIRTGGMEYPQIVMINDLIHPEYEPAEFKALVIHEIAHNWFYGLLANNQTEEEWMDEGFATFAEVVAMERLFGKHGNLQPGKRGWWLKKFGYNNDNRLDQAYKYLQLAKLGLEEDQIDLHADYYGPHLYTSQYSKMGNVLFMLEYTIGDSLFLQSLRNYFKRWRFRHPYREDFISIVEETAQCDLDWFFEQWLDTNRKLDYAIENYFGYWQGQNYHLSIEFQRKEKIFMPIDFDVTLKDGKIFRYQIPVNTFTKPDSNREALPYWHFSKKNHTVEISLPAEMEKIEIDPSLRLMDINRLNNISGFLPPQEFYFMKLQSLAPPLDKYLWEIWPNIFYNDIDKLKVGVKFQGSYLNIDHKIDFYLWYKTAVNEIDLNFHYMTPVNWLGKLSWFETDIFRMDGRQGGKLGIIHRLSSIYQSNTQIALSVQNHKLFDEQYLMTIWDPGQLNTLNFKFISEKQFTRSWMTKQNLQVDISTSIFGSTYDYSQISFELLRKIWKRYSDWELDVRIFSGYSEKNVPAQLLFNLSGDNSWGEFNEPFYRSKGSLPYPWRRTGNLYKHGGGMIHGYSLNSTNFQTIGEKILAFNLDLKLPNPLRFSSITTVRDLNPFIFADIGDVWNGGVIKFKKSVGFGLEWEGSSWLNYLFDLRSIRLDFPFWLSDISAGKNNFDFRWLIRFNFNKG